MDIVSSGDPVTSGTKASGAVEEARLVLLAGAAIILAFGFAAATLMDRPGTWLSKLIHRLLDENAVKQLRSLGRHDLAEVAEVHWKDGEATIVLNQLCRPHSAGR
jgi:hypothetical protein